MSEANNKKNNSFNFLKGLACVGVVLMHISFPGKVGQVIARLWAFAVPLFIMISGYYAYGCEKAKIKKRLKKTCGIFLYGIIVFFICESIVHLRAEDFVAWLASFISIKTLIKLVFFCTIDFATPLWYLIAMIETYILWYFVVTKEKENVAIKFLPILFAAQVISISICDTFEMDWFLKINFLTRAFVWYLLGYFIHSKEIAISQKISNWHLILMLLIGAFIALVHQMTGIKVDFSSVGLLFYAIAIFILGVKNSEKRLGGVIEYIGERLSLNIYVLHCAVALLVNLIADGVWGIAVNPWIYPVIVIAVSVLVAFLIDVLCKVKS